MAGPDLFDEKVRRRRSAATKERRISETREVDFLAEGGASEWDGSLQELVMAYPFPFRFCSPSEVPRSLVAHLGGVVG